jgi:hypothetical protein
LTPPNHAANAAGSKRDGTMRKPGKRRASL